MDTDNGICRIVYSYNFCKATFLLFWTNITVVIWHQLPERLAYLSGETSVTNDKLNNVLFPLGINMRQYEHNNTQHNVIHDSDIQHNVIHDINIQHSNTQH